jgi:hypothetical protein
VFPRRFLETLFRAYLVQSAELRLSGARLIGADPGKGAPAPFRRLGWRQVSAPRR